MGPLQAKALAIVVVVFATSLVSVSAVEAAPISTPPSNCSGGFDPFAYTQQALQACGWPVWPETQTEALAGGGVAYIYDEPRGVTVTDLVPPAGFNPMTAASAQLQEYGFPTKPSSTSSAAAWTQAMSGWTGTASPPPFQTSDPYTNFGPGIWAGYEASGGFYHADSNWIEPPIFGSQCNNAAEGTWTGIGTGTPSDPLMQDGTQVGVYGAHQAWWEAYPYNSSQPTTLYGTAYKQFGSSVRYFSGTNTYQMYMYNFDNGKSFAQLVDSPVLAPSNSTGETIVEEPAGHYLANFGTVSSGHGWWVTSADMNDQPLSIFNPADDYIVDGTNFVMANPTGFDNGSGGFKVSQNRCY